MFLLSAAYATYYVVTLQGERYLYLCYYYSCHPINASFREEVQWFLEGLGRFLFILESLVVLSSFITDSHSALVVVIVGWVAAALPHTCFVGVAVLVAVLVMPVAGIPSVFLPAPHVKVEYYPKGSNSHAAQGWTLRGWLRHVSYPP